MTKFIVSLFLSGFLAFAGADKSNPLLKEWKGSYGGTPPFDQIKVEHFKPAIHEAMELARKNVEAIANSKDQPTFENTIEAFETSSVVFDRAGIIFGVWGSNLSTPDFQKVEAELAPIFSAFSDEIYQNAKLFDKIKFLFESKEKLKLTKEQDRVLTLTYERFVKKGATLTIEQKNKVKDINQKLATLYTQFSQNQLADEGQVYLEITKQDDLKGLPKDLIDSAASEAEQKGKKGSWIFINTRSSIEPFLTYSENRSLREKAFKLWTTRGEKDNANNNNKIITDILKLRKERSKLMGFENFAAWSMTDTMMKNPTRATELMMSVWKPAVGKVKEEVSAMQQIVDQEKGGFKIAPWDYRFYSEKVRKAKYDFDFESVKPYLQLKNVKAGLFVTAEKLFGLKFKPAKKVPVFHDDVEVYEVTDAKGKTVGLWYFDPYARVGKHSGAWMNAYREQSNIKGKKIITIVSNNSNFLKAKKGEPILLSWDDASTMFHEFGHALHGLNSNVTYPSVSGTNTPRDYVEFPSQIMERYLESPDVLNLLVNTKGEKIPQDLIAKLERTKTFNKGFVTVEFLASALVDMKIHTDPAEVIDPVEFEKKTLKDIGMPSEIVMRHRLPAFGHVFSGEEYASGYYSYLWSDVMSSDGYAAFAEKNDPFHKETAKKLKENIFSVGNSQDPWESFKKFRGRNPEVKALLKARGFDDSSSASDNKVN